MFFTKNGPFLLMSGRHVVEIRTYTRQQQKTFNIFVLLTVIPCTGMHKETNHDFPHLGYYSRYAPRKLHSQAKFSKNGNLQGI